jgi:type I restriction enzyme S subunit
MAKKSKHPRVPASPRESEKEDGKPGLVPKLRFPEFRVELAWTVSALGNLATFAAGGTPSKDAPEYWNGHIPWISASSMYDTNLCDSKHKVTSEAIGNGTRIAKVGSLLILTRGSMLYNRVPMGIASIDVAFNQDVRALMVDSEVDTAFLMKQLISQESRIAIHDTGIGAGKIDTDDLRRFLVAIPSLPEQQKIASCLSSLDELIGAQGRKVDALRTHKKGLMQQLFPREGETQPRLRFPEFQDAGDWEEKPLSQIVEVASGQVDPTEPQYSVLPQIGSENIESNTGRLINVKSASDKGVISGNYLFNESYVLYSKIRPGLNKASLPSFKGICSADIYPIRPSNSGMLQSYLLYLLLSPRFLEYAIRNSDRGKIPKINREGLLSFVSSIPSVSEQERIASCLTNLDDLINAQTQKLEALKTHKRGLMQQLFPSPEDAS